jgi:hypothetical protein
MAKQKKRTKFRQVDKSAFWFVGGLDPNRSMRRGCSRWIEIVNALIERNDDGNLVHREPSVSQPTGVLIVRVGTPEWQDIRRDFIYANGFRMCWEPQPTWEPGEPDPSLW